jgi:hypothetical protein
MAPAPHRRWLRRAGLILAGLVALLLVAYLGAVVVLRSVLDPTSLADRAEPHLAAALNRRVSVGAAELSIFPRPEVRLLRVRVENLPDFEGLPLATVDEFHLRPRLLPLLRKRVEVDRVRVVGPRVLLQVDQAGRTNFGDFVPASGEEEEQPAAGISFDVRGIDVREGRVGYRDAVTGRTVQVDGLRIEGSVARTEEGRISLELASVADSARLALPPAWSRGARGLRVGATLRATVGPEAGWIELETGTVTVNGLALGVAGRVDSLTSSRRWVDLRLTGENVDLASITEALPDTLRRALPAEAWGALAADISVRGFAGGGEHPDLDGIIKIREAGLRRGSATPIIDDASVDVQIAERTALISGLRGSLPGGDIRGSGELSLDSASSFRFSVQASADARLMIDASGVAAGDGPEPRSGRLRVDAIASGGLSRPDETSLSGELELANLVVEGGRLASPVTIQRAVLALDGAEARWDGVEVHLADDVVRTSGTIRDLFGRFAQGAPRVSAVEATARSSRLDLDRVLVASESEIGYGRLAWARLGARSVEGRPPEDWARAMELRRPATLAVRGRVVFRADSLIRRPYVMTDAEGVLLLESDRIEIVDARFGIYGGRGTATGSLRLGADSSQPFRLNMSLDGVRAEEYLAQNSPLGRLVSGALTLDLSLEGGMDTLSLPLARALQGVGRFELRDGRIASNTLTRGILEFLRLDGVTDLEFSHWVSPFTIREGALELNGSDFTGSALVAELQGALGFGGSLDLGALVRPDSALARGAAAAGGAAGEVLARYLDRGGALELALRLTGQASDPRVELDPDAMQQSTRSVLEEAAEQALRSGEEGARERGLELLRGLTGQRGDSASAADTSGSAADTTSSGAR